MAATDLRGAGLTLAIQKELLAQHYSLGPTGADGDWGPKTRGAMNAYQIANHLPITALPDQVLIGRLLGKALPVPIGWLDEATRLLGLREGPGRKDNPVILDWADDLDLHYPSDDIAWCGLFMAHCVRTALPDEPLPANPLGARQWEKFGLPCAPQLGAVAVFWRKTPASGLGHVGFLVGERKDAFLVRGGNQDDQVKDAWVSRKRFVDARWPATGGKPLQRPLTVGGAGALSTNEA